MQEENENNEQEIDDDLWMVDVAEKLFQPHIIQTFDNGEPLGCIIFPVGVQAYARHQNADLISIEDGEIYLYQNGVWNPVTDVQNSSSVVNLRGNRPSTLTSPDKPRE